jgi:hypothetical protein
MDPESGAVVFVGNGRGAEALKPVRERLWPRGARIEAVAMNRSAAYHRAVFSPKRSRTASHPPMFGRGHA